MKDAGSFIHHSKRDLRFINNIYSARLISYPSGVSFKSFSINHAIENFELTSAIKVINYGDLTDADNNIEAKEQLINFTILQKKYSNYILGASVAYQFSWIGEYMQSSAIYNAGLSKNIIRDRWNIGISIEDYTRIINQFSNLDDKNRWAARLSSEYDPTHIPIKLLIDYIYNNRSDNELIIALDIDVDRHLRILCGKSYYYDKQKYANSVFSNFGVGAELILNNLIFNLGFQYIENGILSVGTGLTTEFR